MNRREYDVPYPSHRGNARYCCVSLRQGEAGESAPPGVGLVATDEVQALSMVRKNGFKHVASPLEFVREVAASATRQNCGHLVLAEHGRTDYALAARLAAALLGAYLATLADYVANGRQCGTQFASSFNSASRRQLYIAVSPDMSKDFPTVPLPLAAHRASCWISLGILAVC